MKIVAVEADLIGINFYVVAPKPCWSHSKTPLERVLAGFFVSSVPPPYHELKKRAFHPFSQINYPTNYLAIS
jgi:hypothetical protein